MSRRATVLMLLFLLFPATAHAQLFLASRPRPEFAVSPLFIRARVRPAVPDVTVDILFSVVIPPTRSALEFEQALYLLWPGAVASAERSGPPDAALAAHARALGLTVVGEGRLPLFAQRHYESAEDAESIAGGAPYATVVRTGGPLGTSAPATYIRIPWTPKLVNQAWLMDVRLTAKDLVKPRPANWVRRAFWGPRYSLALGFNDVGGPAMFALYYAQRGNVIRLTHPSQLMASFAAADALGIDAIAPQASRRDLRGPPENTEVVSLFLDRLQGLTPQVLSIEFSYLTRLQSWGPVVIPVLFFVLGNVAAVLLQHLARRVGPPLAARIQVGRRLRDRPDRSHGTVISREQLARIAPGETTYDEVLRLCGTEVEEQEDLTTPGRRTLIYRGRLEVPHRRWRLGWVATVSRWDVEQHEVEIVFADERVRDVQARVRRTRLATPSHASPP